MMENQMDLNKMLDKYVDGSASSTERALLENWYNALAASGSGMEVDEVEIEQAHRLIWEGIGLEKKERVEDAVVLLSPGRVSRLWPRIAAAAMIVLSLGIGYYIYESKKIAGEAVAYQNDVAPGKDGATLTLANGRKILIGAANLGELALESGVRISKNEKGQLVYEVLEGRSAVPGFNTLTTTRGQQSQVRLPDGSLVFLNAESSLRYAVDLGKGEKREVSLSGEGYFEVAPNQSRPFVVSSLGQQVEVLGTHFNVNAYSDNGVKTTLVEGSVRVSGNSAKAILVPGDQSVFAGKDFTISQVNVDDVVAWKEGFFVFKRKDLDGVMEDVARWYDVEVEFADSGLKDLHFTGSVSRYEKVSQVLRKLEAVNPVSFEVKGKRIVVKKGNVR